MACFVFFICVAGVAYNILRNVPLYGEYTDQQGVMNYLIFSRGMKTQFGLEGYIFSSIILLFSFAIIALTYIPKMKFSQ